MRIRRLQAHEEALFRQLRLRALEDAPDAFADTFADTLARPDSYWANLTRSVTDPQRHVMFTNPPAVNLYQRLGFVATGRSNALPSSPRLQIVEMTRALEPRAPMG